MLHYSCLISNFSILSIFLCNVHIFIKTNNNKNSILNSFLEKEYKEREEKSMSKRKKLTKPQSKSMFRQGAKMTQSFNLTPKPQRGGYRV